MACTGCTTKFSLLTKEHVCPLCNFLFCSKCLKKSLEYSDGQGKVCHSCLAKTGKNKNEEIEPPVMLLKRLEMLDNPAKPPVTVFRNDDKFASLKRGLSDKDVAIVDRLEKLRKKQVNMVPSVSEINERLRALQGKMECESSNRRLVIPPSKPSHEQVDDLLMQYMEEMQIDNSESSTDDLELRLAILKGKDSNRKSPPADKGDSGSEDEDGAAAQVVQRALDEAALPDSGQLTPPPSPNYNSSGNELPWCEICNNDATVRCLGCDGALYCNRCLKEGHDYLELKEHKTVSFEPKASTSND